MSGFRNASYNPLTGVGDAAGSTGAYTLTLNNLSDLNDQISEAIATAVGETIGGVISPTQTSPDPEAEVGDVDMFRFTVAAGQRVGFDIDRPAGSSLDSWIRLFDAAGTQLAFNDDGAAPGEGASTESYLEYTFASAGTYYLGVSGFRNASYNPLTGVGDAAGSTGAYTLTLNNLSDLNDQISEAIATAVGETIGGVISPTRTSPDPEAEVGDVDMFRFTVAAGQRVGFDIDRPAGSSLDSWIRLFDAAGTQLAFNDDGASARGGCEHGVVPGVHVRQRRDVLTWACRASATRGSGILVHGLLRLSPRIHGHHDRAVAGWHAYQDGVGPGQRPGPDLCNV